VSQVLAAILWLVPSMPEARAERYAQIINDAADRWRIAPLLIVAEIYVESRFRRRAYSKKNYGLMQVRVSKNVHAKYLGREQLLFEPRRNIYTGVAMLAFWKRYHHRRCRNRPPHPWWSHYQWGRRVRNTKSGVKVKKLYYELKERFARRGET